MILFKDILDLLQPRQRLPPSLQKLIYDHNSAINDHGLQNFFVHFSYEIIPRYFELITTASAVAALTSKNGSMIIAWQQMILGFWNFVYTSLRKIPKYFGLITTAPAVAASPFKNWCMIITRQLTILGLWFFFVQLPYEIISRYFRTHHNRASGCRLFLYNIITFKKHLYTNSKAFGKRKHDPP